MGTDHNISIPLQVNNGTLHASPAESTLTAGTHNPLAIPIPTIPTISTQPFLGSPDDVDFGGDDEFFDTDDGNSQQVALLGTSANTDSWSEMDAIVNASDNSGVVLNYDNDFDERDGGDSDDEGDVSNLHVLALARRLVGDDEGEEIVNVADAEWIVMTHPTPTSNDVEIDDDIGEPTSASATATATALLGAPEGWTPPQPPPTFTGYVRKHNAPAEEDIDNPGAWSMFTFTPEFDKSNKNKFHSSPTGARVVPADSNGKRCMNGWEFHYQNWHGDEEVESTYARPGAGLGDLKPKSRMGRLDVDVLKKHGLTASRVRNDPMFFYQMLFPFCNPLESGVAEDHRMPYFALATVFTNMYAFAKGAGTGYGHDFPPVSISELVHWTGVPVRNGALDGRPATLQHRWKNKNDPRYDSVTDNAITFQRWRQIKRFFKLCNGIKEVPRGHAGYDPCVKYDYVWKCLIHNMNYVTASADLDCTIDETTWGFSGYSAEAGGRLMNKPVSKGECSYLYEMPSSLMLLT
jgi:hypothetical protein